MKNIGLRDRIRGSLIGGAAGDALGYAVEFSSEYGIFSMYGKPGITEYDRDEASGLALFSDDTQMTLFTAAGLLRAETQGMPYQSGIDLAYRDWLITQGEAPRRADERWPLTEKQLFARRAPGHTCITAMRQRMGHEPETDYIGSRLNSSKGCGGIMRIAPVALINNALPLRERDMLAAQAAAITHSHPLGYMCCAPAAHVIRRILTDSDSMTLKEMVLEARDALPELFPENGYVDTLTELIDRAVALSENDESDLDNIHKLGEGWVGEEAMAIALYCVLRHPDDFDACLIAAVNHRGDSDSTGAIAGNIVGAMVGYDAIAEKWKTHLELRQLLLDTADDLYTARPETPDAIWNQKYAK